MYLKMQDKECSYSKNIGEFRMVRTGIWNKICILQKLDE